jgi:NUMOD3 motif
MNFWGSALRDNLFYAYLWLRKDRTPYYVGKGCGHRAFTSNGHNIHCPKNRIQIVVIPALNEEEAFSIEKALIQIYGRKNNGSGILRNLTNGGEGFSGVVFDEEHRRKLSESASQRTGEKNPFFGKVHSSETKDRMRIAAIGRPNPFKGKKHSVETIKAISAKAKGRVLSAETRKKLSEAVRKARASHYGNSHPCQQVL